MERVVALIEVNGELKSGCWRHNEMSFSQIKLPVLHITSSMHAFRSYEIWHSKLQAKLNKKAGDRKLMQASSALWSIPSMPLARI